MSTAQREGTTDGATSGDRLEEVPLRECRKGDIIIIDLDGDEYEIEVESDVQCSSKHDSTAALLIDDDCVVWNYVGPYETCVQRLVR